MANLAATHFDPWKAPDDARIKTSKSRPRKMYLLAALLRTSPLANELKRPENGEEGNAHRPLPCLALPCLDLSYLT